MGISKDIRNLHQLALSIDISTPPIMVPTIDKEILLEVVVSIQDI